MASINENAEGPGTALQLTASVKRQNLQKWSPFPIEGLQVSNNFITPDSPEIFPMNHLIVEQSLEGSLIVLTLATSGHSKQNQPTADR